ncbi:hypothetical protein J7F03_31265 [Streptomyces sp. ISL-43]|uniref:hypothetical protein n=1 Tax=Streptomyces sp. ISL-43 TaxID=2819183 RepID=UPI001BE7A26B|nr:hypothetical protein [Streptomyces sp. ISL-43]MBT2451465.1 hypothetical protein [Streptomyces sp. ISL-43]
MAHLKRAEKAEEEARERLADEIGKVAPYAPDPVRTGSRTPDIATIYKQLTDGTGYRPRQLDSMRAKAAQRLAKKDR